MTLNRNKFSAVILAAGTGKRMKSSKPKAMHEIAGLPMIGHVIKNLSDAGCGEMILVIAPFMEDVADFARGFARDFASMEIQTAIQKQPRGTADALEAALPKLTAGFSAVIAAYGDTPLVPPKTYAQLAKSRASVSVCGFTPRSPRGYGRIFCEKGAPTAIIEDDGSLMADNYLCNAGVMGFAAKDLPVLLKKIGADNAQGERYLTSIVELAAKAGLSAKLFQCAEMEASGVNRMADLAQLESFYQDHLRQKALEKGVQMAAPQTVYFSWDTQMTPSLMLAPYIVFGTGVKIGKNVRIESFSHIEGAVIKNNAVIGPYARLRPGASIGEDARIGNFVEVKRAQIGKGVRANHLAYLGDAIIGARTNIGAGTITCNYDGEKKHMTEIGADAFIGSNAALVAPVKIGKGAYIGSGSTITDNVKAGALALGRARQVEKSRRQKKKKKA